MGDNLVESWIKQIQWYSDNYLSEMNRLDGHMGGRPGTVAGQAVDTRVLGRLDKWDGSEKA